MPLNITEKIIRENALNNTRKRNPGVKFNPGLSANRPSNNWALYRIYNLSLLVGWRFSCIVVHNRQVMYHAY